MLPPLTHYKWYRRDDDGGRLILSLHIQPGAKHTEAVRLHGDALKIKLAASPVEGVANTVLQKFLAEIFCVPLRQVRLTQGIKSRRKVVEIWQTAIGPEALYKAADPEEADLLSIPFSEYLGTSVILRW